MKRVEIQLTGEQRERLMADISESRSDDEHLSDDDFVTFAAGRTGAKQTKQTQAHLEKCSACAADMQEFVSQTEPWRTEEGEKRLVALRERLLSTAIDPVEPQRTVTLWGQLGDFLSVLKVPNPFSLAPQPLYRTPLQVPSYETEDRLFGISFHEEEKGNLTVYIDSRRMDLEGKELVIESGPRQWRVTLRRADSNLLSARMTIPLSELRPLQGAELSVRLAGIQSREDVTSKKSG